MTFFRSIRILCGLACMVFLTVPAIPQQQKETGKPVPDHVPGTLILKVMKEKIDQWQELLNNKELEQQLPPALGKVTINRIFPHHEAVPATATERNSKLVDLSTMYRMQFDRDFPLDALIFRLNRLKMFEYAEPSPVVMPLFFPNDAKLSSQYYLSTIKAYQAWDICQGDTSVVIGIVDSGTDLDHEDLLTNLKYNYNDPIDGIDNDNDGFVDNFRGWDMGDMDNDPQVIPGGGSDVSHGVHMCGIAGASTNNLLGVAGVGFNCKFLPVKMNDVNNYYLAGFEGIVYAADHDCKVINCSWGSPFSNGKFGQDIINYATYNRDVLVVAASGNSDSEIPFYPASYENVLSVGATGPSDERMLVVPGYATSFGMYLDVCAPGLGIFNTWDYPYFYKSLSGTSMAAAVVSGAAALVRSRFPGLTALQTAEKLRITSDRIDTLPANLPYYGKLGAGRINVFRALTDTLSPSFRILNHKFTDGNDSVFMAGDTVNLTGLFYNFLRDAQNASVTIRCANPYVVMIDSVLLLGNVPGSSGIINYSNPLTFKLLPGIPSDAALELQLLYRGDAFQSFEFVKLVLNSDFINIQAQKISTSITSKGKIGYNDDFNSHGLGFCFRNGMSLLFSGGFLVGTGYAKVSDAVYNSDFNGYDLDFDPVQKVTPVIPSQLADNEIVAVFNDSLAGTNAIGVISTHRILTWDQEEDSRFVVHQLTIKNQGINNLANLYVGLFVDWDINPFAADYDRISWDATNKMGICSSLNGGPLAGISLITNGPVKHYAFDMNGQNGSIKITDGFTSQEKYTSLKSSRPQAGLGASGNNVADQVSSGPFLLLPGDSVVVAFGMMAADHLTDLQSAAVRAMNRYFNTPGSTDTKPAFSVPALTVFPNPAASSVALRLYLDHPANIDITVHDLIGKTVTDVKKVTGEQGWNDVSLLLNDLPAGTYFVRVCKDGHFQYCKLSKL